MTSRERSRRGDDPRARERLGALARSAPLVRAVPESADGDPRDNIETLQQDDSTDVGREEVDDERRDDADDLLARLRSGALTTAATAYTAANGHPLEHPDLLDAPERRWRISVRSAVVVAIVLLVVAAVVVLRGWTSSAGAVVPFEESRPAADPFAVETGNVVVHVVGEVGDPGIVELSPGSRVAEAVDAAGGATRDAALGAVNLARVVEDGEQILVPSQASGNAGSDEGAEVASSDPRLDLNSADPSALESLPGIGPVLAERIVAWRADHGRFSSVDELAEVSGIGPSLLGQLRDLVRIG